MKVKVEDESGANVFEWDGYAESITDALVKAEDYREEQYGEEIQGQMDAAGYDPMDGMDS